VAILLMLPLVLTACDGGANQSSPNKASSPAVCGYLYEWLSSFRFPLQPDPHAAYSYVIPKISDDPVALEITGQFPFAAWTSWTIYTDLQARLQPFSVVKDADITPDQGSVNPFVVGTPVLAPKRDYRLLVLPKGTDTPRRSSGWLGGFRIHCRRIPPAPSIPAGRSCRRSAWSWSS
jgi:hypothetical protein